MSKRCHPASNVVSSESPTIKLEDGFARINTQGIQPFIQCIENNEREFFKAKEFVTLYDLIFKMVCNIWISTIQYNSTAINHNTNIMCYLVGDHAG